MMLIELDRFRVATILLRTYKVTQRPCAFTTNRREKKKKKKKECGSLFILCTTKSLGYFSFSHTYSIIIDESHGSTFFFFFIQRCARAHEPKEKKKKKRRRKGGCLSLYY